MGWALLNLGKTGREHARAWFVRAAELRRLRWLRRVGAGILAFVVFYTLAGFFGIPLLLRHLGATRAAAMLARPVSLGDVRFNPYTLRLRIEKLHIGERGAAQPFLDIGRLRVKASWMSLFRFAPVISDVMIDWPAVHVVRTAPQRFNFSDLLGSSSTQKSSKPFRFAVSNIRLREGEVRFDDQVVKARHTVRHIQIGVPFIADLPADVDVYVQPLLQMVVDGSPVLIAGKVKPFSSPPESVLGLNLHRLDLARYVGYLPRTLPLKIPQGTLSGFLHMDFVSAASQPLIRLGGELTLDKLDVRDGADAPLISLNRATATLTDIEPLNSVVSIGAIRMDGVTANIVVKRDGTTNLTPLLGGNAVSANPQPATQAARQGAPAAISVESFDLSNGALNISDNHGATPATLAIRDMHFGVKNLQTSGQTRASFEASASLARGGKLAAKGALNLAGSEATTDVTLDQIDLAALQNFAQSVLAASIAAGKLSARANLQTHFASGHFNVESKSASLLLDKLELRSPGEVEKPLAWNRLSVSVEGIDLAARQVALKEVHVDDLRLFVRRGRDGALSLAALLGKTPPSTGPAPSAPSPPAPPWHYRIASVAVEKAEASLEDDLAPGSQPVKLAIAPLNLHLKDLSDDFGKPVPLDLDGTVDRKGSFKVTGSAALTPLKADLRVATKQLELAAMEPYVANRLNATITAAALTMDGALGVAHVSNTFGLNYRGDATLGNVRVLDKLTGGRFLRWGALSASHIDAEFGAGQPRVHVGALTLANFYARVILNANARLNLSDITSPPGAKPTSVTQPESVSAAARTQGPGGSAGAAGRPIGADLRVGQVTLQGGNIKYTDYFIRPNYSANLSDIAGKIGTFGTHSTSPADVVLSGKVNSTSPLAIEGKINPLTPMASLDLSVRANGVDLTSVTPYSTKYTGYPITKGTLTINVHYLLEEQKLTAENHILLDQLTFGPRVESPSAVNLPVRLAVDLLKDPQGQIKVDVPVSGSLSDPQFSFGNAILHAFLNLIVNAVTSPFRLLASVVGGVGGKGEELSYVAFAPGRATLTPDDEQKLATLAKALQDRPALQLDISGRVDPAFDREGLRQAKLDDLVKAEKIKDLVGQGRNVRPDQVTVSSDEYDSYLKAAYKGADFPKPKNLIGLDKSLAPDEMKKLMLTHIDVTDQDLRRLADARANAVRKWLSAKVNPARLFVTAPKLNANGVTGNAKTTRADLSLE